MIRAEAVENYCRQVLAWRTCRVEQLEEVFGGISRETWRAAVVGLDGFVEPQHVILRIDPELSLMDSQRHIEYAMYTAFHDAPGVPVPRAICVEDDRRYLGSTFLMTEQVDGEAKASPILRDEFRPVGPAIARSMYQILAAIADIDVNRSELRALGPLSDVTEAATRQLDYWEGVLAENPVGPAAGINAAIRGLRRQPPVPDRVTVVHGDYRLGNFLYRSDGSIAAILDWEMAHLGDPLEDLAWSMHRSWRPAGSEANVCGYLTPEEAIEIYQEARGGIEIDRSALTWWRLFTCVKAFALAATMAHRFMSASRPSLVGAMVGWGSLGQDELAALDLLEEVVA